MISLDRPIQGRFPSDKARFIQSLHRGRPPHHFAGCHFKCFNWDVNDLFPKSSFAREFWRKSYFCVDFRCSLGKSQLIYTGRGAISPTCLRGIGELFAYSSKLSPLSHRTCKIDEYSITLPCWSLLKIRLGIPRASIKTMPHLHKNSAWVYHQQSFTIPIGPFRHGKGAWIFQKDLSANPKWWRHFPTLTNEADRWFPMAWFVAWYRSPPGFQKKRS